MKKAVTIILLLWSTFASSQIGVYNGKPRYNILAVRAGNDTIGNVILELYPAIAPKHVRNWDSLTAAKFFDSTAFHRVIPGFVIQGGDPNSKKGPRGTWGYGQPWQVNIPAEFNPISHQRGILSAARDADPNSANSQFFICVAPATHLDWAYTAYGKATEGMSVVDNIVQSPRDVNDNPNLKIEMFVTRLSDDTSKLATSATILQPANNAQGISANYTFKWDALPGALIYELELSKDPNFASIDTVIKTNKTSTTVASIQPGLITYYWRLLANNGGYKTASEIRSFTTGTFPPSLLTPTQNEVLTSTYTSFTWNSAPSATSYKLQVATNPNFTLASIKLEVDSIVGSMYVTTKLEPNKKHFWRVASEIDFNAGAYSASRTFTTGAAVGIESTTNNNQLILYPNPATTELNIKGIENAEYEIYNSIGQLVQHGTSLGSKVDIGALEKGMYLLKVESGVGRFIIE